MGTTPQNLNTGETGGPDRPALDLEQPHRHHMIPVWFFVGIILLIYGVIILGTGIYEFSTPPPTVLASTHPALWWGALLAIIGAVYVFLYRPKS